MNESKEQVSRGYHLDKKNYLGQHVDRADNLQLLDYSITIGVPTHHHVKAAHNRVFIKRPDALLRDPYHLSCKSRGPMVSCKCSLNSQMHPWNCLDAFHAEVDFLKNLLRKRMDAHAAYHHEERKLVLAVGMQLSCE